MGVSGLFGVAVIGAVLSCELGGLSEDIFDPGVVLLVPRALPASGVTAGLGIGAAGLGKGRFGIAIV